MFKMRSILVKLLLLACVWVRSFAFDVHYEQNGNARCLSMEYNFRFFTRILQKKCVKECATRPMCQAVNYHRSHQLCELLSQDVGNVSDFAPPCELIKKSDIEVTLPTECNQCTEGETCEINDHTGSGTCVIKECKPLKLTNGHILGNMKAIDLRIVYLCDEGYKRSTVVNVSVCLSNGSWSGDPDCIPVTAHYLGCYLNCNVRLLKFRITQSDFNPATTDNCIRLCSSKGYNFANTEYGIVCFCGNEVLHFTKLDESECNTSCIDNTNQICGGVWRSSLYNLTMYTGRNGIINNEQKCAHDGTCIPPC